MATFGFPSATDVFIPSANYSAEISASLVINFSRAPNKFKVLDYTKLVPVKRRVGFYKRVLPYQAGRVSSTGNEFKWNPGQDSPTAHWNRLPFTNLPFATQRYRFSTPLEYLERDQADFPIQEMHAAMLAQQAMTNRTRQVFSVLNDTGNYLSSHVVSATSLAGGKLDAGTINDRYIQSALDKASFLIEKATLSTVTKEDLTVVMSPVVASALARSQELAAFQAQQEQAAKFLSGGLPVPANTDWRMLPAKLYGYNVIVERTTAFDSENPVTDEEAETASYVADEDTIYILARPGDITGVEGVGDFSSVHIFTHEEMSSEIFDEPIHRRLNINVTEDIDVRLVAPPCTVKITDVLT